MPSESSSMERRRGLVIGVAGGDALPRSELQVFARILE
jgi:hypothetical protein